MKHKRVRTCVLISQFSTKYFAVPFRLFLKIASYFRFTFLKTPLVAGIFLCDCWSWRFWRYIYVFDCSETIPKAVDETAAGRICASMVVWMHVLQLLLTGYSEDDLYVFSTQRGNKLLFSPKLSKNQQFSDSFRRNRSSLIRLHSLYIRSEIWRRYLNILDMQGFR